MRSSSVKPAASASASMRVSKARRRRSCSRGGWARAAVPLTNEPDAAAGLDHSGAFQLRVHPGHRVGVDAEVDRELPHRRQLIADLQTARRDRRPQPAFELRVDRRAIPRVDRHDGHGP